MFGKKHQCIGNPHEVREPEYEASFCDKARRTRGFDHSVVSLIIDMRSDISGKIQER